MGAVSSTWLTLGENPSRHEDYSEDKPSDAFANPQNEGDLLSLSWSVSGLLRFTICEGGDEGEVWMKVAEAPWMKDNHSE